MPVDHFLYLLVIVYSIVKDQLRDRLSEPWRDQIEPIPYILLLMFSCTWLIAARVILRLFTS